MEGPRSLRELSLARRWTQGAISSGLASGPIWRWRERAPMDTGQPPHQRYDYLLLLVGSITVDPDFSIDRSVEHRCSSVLIWPQGEQPSRHNTVLTDPCFTDRGFPHAAAHLNRLGLAFGDIGRIFVTHRHGDHRFSLLDRTVRSDFARFRPGVTGPLSGISTLPCPGHTPEWQALVFRSSTGRNRCLQKSSDNCHILPTSRP